MRFAFAVLLTFAPLFARGESSSNTFGADFFRAARAHDGEGVANRVISPVANYVALGMAATGAAGRTRAELLRTLGAGPEMWDFLENTRDCARRLVTSPRPDHKTDARLKISNGAWHSDQLHGGRPFDFNADFRRSLDVFYDAEVGAVNFGAPAAATHVNEWAERQTLGLIPTVVSADEIKDLMFLLMNATYFEGSWAQNFFLMRPDEWNAERTTFHLADGTNDRRTMISSSGHYAHVRRDGAEFIEIPFVSPDDREFVFYVALPAHGQSPAEFFAPQAWAKVVDALNENAVEYGTVTLPKFAFDYTYELKAETPLTNALRLDFLFADAADFGGLKTPESASAKVGLVKGVNRIELDEMGVKAAAVVMVGGIEATSVGPRPSFDVRVDRPFAFAIAEKKSGTLVFVGEVQNPH